MYCKIIRRPTVIRFSHAYYRDQGGTIYAGLDAGTTNMSFCVTRQNGKQITVLHADMIPPYVLIRDFEDVGAWQRITDYQTYMAALLDRYKPKVLVGELFFLRGFRTNLGTPINFMLGIVAMLCQQRGIKFIGVNAGTWKGIAWLKQKTTVEELYPYHGVNHLVDGTMLSLYANKSVLESLSKADLIALVKTIPQPKVETKLRAKSKKKKKAAKSKKKKKAAKSKRSRSAR